MLIVVMTAHRTLILRRPSNGQSKEAERLSARLVAQPGVEWVRIDTMPFCVTLRVDPALADQPALRAMVLHDGVAIAGSETALRMQARFGTMLPKAARVLAAAF
jgi:hypothetical protein